jgi:hypothetical protein
MVNARRKIRSFPHARVTSDLDPEIEKAEDCHGESGRRQIHANGRNPFVLKILTSNPLALKILPAIFARPAPVKAFRGWGEGGYTPGSTGFPKLGNEKIARSAQDPTFFSHDFHKQRKGRSERAAKCIGQSEKSEIYNLKSAVRLARSNFCILTS